MLAQMKHEVVVRPIVRQPRGRKRKNLLRALFHNQMACILLLAVAVLFLLIPYASAYARVTEKGYQKTNLMSSLRELRLENESLRVSLEELRQPDRIAAFAAENGMEQGTTLAYLRPTSRPNLAKSIDHGDIK